MNKTMYQPLQVSQCEKCGKGIAEPKELTVRLIPDVNQ